MKIMVTNIEKSESEIKMNELIAECVAQHVPTDLVPQDHTNGVVWSNMDNIIKLNQRIMDLELRMQAMERVK